MSIKILSKELTNEILKPFKTEKFLNAILEQEIPSAIKTKDGKIITGQPVDNNTMNQLNQNTTNSGQPSQMGVPSQNNPASNQFNNVNQGNVNTATTTQPVNNNSTTPTQNNTNSKQVINGKETEVIQSGNDPLEKSKPNYKNFKPSEPDLGLKGSMVKENWVQNQSKGDKEYFYFNEKGALCSKRNNDLIYVTGKQANQILKSLKLNPKNYTIADPREFSGDRFYFIVDKNKYVKGKSNYNDLKSNNIVKEDSGVGGMAAFNAPAFGGDTERRTLASGITNEMSQKQRDTKYEEYISDCKKKNKKCMNFKDWDKQQSNKKNITESLKDFEECIYAHTDGVKLADRGSLIKLDKILEYEKPTTISNLKKVINEIIPNVTNYKIYKVTYLGALQGIRIKFRTQDGIKTLPGKGHVYSVFKLDESLYKKNLKDIIKENYEELDREEKFDIVASKVLDYDSIIHLSQNIQSQYCNSAKRFLHDLEFGILSRRLIDQLLSEGIISKVTKEIQHAFQKQIINDADKIYAELEYKMFIVYFDYSVDDNGAKTDVSSRVCYDKSGTIKQIDTSIYKQNISGDAKENIKERKEQIENRNSEDNNVNLFLNGIINTAYDEIYDKQASSFLSGTEGKLESQKNDNNPDKLPTTKELNTKLNKKSLKKGKSKEGVLNDSK